MLLSFIKSYSFLVNSTAINNYFHNHISLDKNFDKNEISIVFSNAEQILFHRQIFDEHAKKFPNIKFVHVEPIYDYEKISNLINGFNKTKEANKKFGSTFEEKINSLKEQCYEIITESFICQERSVHVIDDNQIIATLTLKPYSYNKNIYIYTEYNFHSEVFSSDQSTERNVKNLNALLYNILV